MTCWPVDPFDPLTHLTRWPVWPVDPSTCWPFRKRTPQGNCEVHLHKPLRCDPFDPLTRRPFDPSTRWPFRKRTPRGQLRGAPTYSVEMQCSKRRRIRLCCLPAAKQKAPLQRVAWGWRIYNIVESENDPLTRRPVDLFEKEPLKGKWEVYLHTPTKFGEDPSKDLGGDREHTNKHIHTQINAARIIVWCVTILHAMFANYQIKPWATSFKRQSLWWLQIATLNLLWGFCEYVWVDSLTLSPWG